MRQIIKIALISVIVLIIAAAIFSVSIYLKYSSVEKQNILPELVATEIVPESSVTLGKTQLLRYQIKCPWNKRPLESEITEGKGAQAVGEPEFIKVKTGGDILFGLHYIKFSHI